MVSSRLMQAKINSAICGMNIESNRIMARRERCLLPPQMMLPAVIIIATTKIQHAMLKLFQYLHNVGERK